MKKTVRRLSAAFMIFLGFASADTLNSSAYADVCMIGEVRQFGATYAPRNWALTNGQLLSTNSNQALFSILGTIYGGDGRTTFGLPDLRGRAAIGVGNGPGLSNRRLGGKVGVATTPVNANTMPKHSHAAQTIITLKASSANGDTRDPGTNVLANDGSSNIYNAQTPDVSLAATSVEAATEIDQAGGSASFNTYQPSLGLSYIICLTGIYPMRN